MRVRGVVSIGLVVLLGAGVAAALDSIAIPGKPAPKTESLVEAGGSVACPGLTRIKYPFIRCYVDDLGNLQLDTRGGPGFARSIPELSPFVEGDGYWGADRER